VRLGTKADVAEPVNLWSLKQLAAHFGVCINTAKKYPIAFTRAGRQRRYHPALVKRYEVLRASKPLDWKEVA
jgi:hypothetical protein